MKQIKLWNTLARQKSIFTPIDKNNVRMYVCGPTVYDFAHIGNARPAIVFDVLFRLLRNVFGSEHVTYVRNITDVDDKINARAMRDHPDTPLNEAIRKVTEKTALQYFNDMKSLGCLEPTVQPRATDHIEAMIKMIQKLIDLGHAYIEEGMNGKEIIFSTVSMPAYGALSKRIMGDQRVGSRINQSQHKHDAGDFVLWKESSETQPGWTADFTFGKEGLISIFGRPGWHIECSAMSEVHLGETFDIHGGGLDLIFPHHENEIAQSTCAHNGQSMANIWMHNGFLQIDGKKMAKSEGNFLTIIDLLETDRFGGRKWSGAVLRLAMLMTHYREPINFTVNRLEEAQAIIDRWTRLELHNDHEGEKEGECEIAVALLDDLNTPSLISQMQTAYKAAQSGDKASLSFIKNGMDILGFCSLVSRTDNNIDVEILSDIKKRLVLLSHNCFEEADRIRDEMASKGIHLTDIKDTETGERKTLWNNLYISLT